MEGVLPSNPSFLEIQISLIKIFTRLSLETISSEVPSGALRSGSGNRVGIDTGNTGVDHCFGSGQPFSLANSVRGGLDLLLRFSIWGRGERVRKVGEVGRRAGQ